MKYAIAKALAHADVPSSLAVVIKAVATAPNKAALLETGLTADYLKDKYDSGSKEARQKQWKAGFAIVAGEQGVASSGLSGVASHITAKGFSPFVLPANWVDVLGDMDAPTEDKVLSTSERKGEVLSDPTPDMLRAVDEVWDVIVSMGMQNGKEKPPVKAFMSIMDAGMDAGAQRRGEYRDGTVLLHTDLAAGPLLKKVALEELAHHVTGATDMSRDLQDWLFRLVVAIVW